MTEVSKIDLKANGQLQGSTANKIDVKKEEKTIFEQQKEELAKTKQELYELLDEPIPAKPEVAKPANVATEAVNEDKSAVEDTANADANKTQDDVKKDDEPGFFSKAVDTIATYTGIKQMGESLDRKNGRTELAYKDTVMTGVVSAIGNIAAQPTDIASYVTEKATFEDASKAADEKLSHVEGENVTNAAKDVAKGGAGLLKITNGIMEGVGGLCDLTSSTLKLEQIMNDKIDAKAKASLEVLAKQATDLSMENVNDKITAYALTVRLGLTAEELQKMSPNELQAELQKEQKNLRTLQQSQGELSRDTIVAGATGKAAEELIEVYSAYLVYQQEEGTTKLDKAGTALREGTSELLNIPAATVDIVSESIKSVSQDIPVAENVGNTVSGALEAVSGTLQGVTTLWDGKDGSTTSAWKKAGNGIVKLATFGFFGNDEKADDVAETKTAVEETPKSEAELQAEKRAEWAAVHTKALEESYKNDFMKSAIAESVKVNAEINYQNNLDTLRKEGNQEKIKEYEAQKDATIAALSAKLLTDNKAMYDEKIAENSGIAKETVQKNVNKVLSEHPDAFTTDTKRIALRATNATTEHEEAFNHLDATYSNSDNPEIQGELTGMETAERIGKGMLMAIPRWLFSKSVTAADQIAAGTYCHFFAAAEAAHNAITTGVNGYQLADNNPSNTAAIEASREQYGAAATWGATSAVAALGPEEWVWGQHNHRWCHHNHNHHNGSPCDDLINDPTKLGTK